MNLDREVERILAEVLGLNVRWMAAVGVITALQEQLGTDVDIDGATYASVGSLTDFFASKTAA